MIRLQWQHVKVSASKVPAEICSHRKPSKLTSDGSGEEITAYPPALRTDLLLVPHNGVCYRSYVAADSALRLTDKTIVASGR